MKYRSYVKELSLLPRIGITTLAGLVLFACAYLVALTASYLLSRYVKTSILTATGLVNLYIAFPSLKEPHIKSPTKRTGSPTSSTENVTDTPAIIYPPQATNPLAQRPAAPVEAAVIRPALADQGTARIPLSEAGKTSASSMEVGIMSFAAVAREFIEKLNDGDLDDNLPPSEFSDGDIIGDE